MVNESTKDTTGFFIDHIFIRVMKKDKIIKYESHAFNLVVTNHLFVSVSMYMFRDTEIIK